MNPEGNMKNIFVGIIITITIYLIIQPDHVFAGSYGYQHLSQWWETVDLENQDRKNRLQRLSHFNGTIPPQFSEELIPASKLGNLLKGTSLEGIPVLRVIFKNRVFFDTNQSTIRPDAQEIIDLVAESLRREPPDVALFISGHTDSRGTDAYNYNLSIDRANAVANAIVNKGIGLAAVWRIGFGESIPIASNSTPQGMAKNRRVEFLFAAKPAAIAVWLAEQAANTCTGISDKELQQCRKEVRVHQVKPVAIPIVAEPKSIKPPTRDRREIRVGSPRSIPAPHLGRTVQPQPVKFEQKFISIKDDPNVPVKMSRNDTIVIDLANETFSIPEPKL